jgi:hypothetical protein
MHINHDKPALLRNKCQSSASPSEHLTLTEHVCHVSTTATSAASGGVWQLVATGRGFWLAFALVGVVAAG